MSVQTLHHLRVRGRVQGVGYRAFVEREAIRHGLAGWVRNRTDGSVEAILAGPAETVAAVIEACRRGPTLARVDAVETGAPPAGLPSVAAGDGFRVLPTA
ncbi:acylphosphatase [Ancylobacter terrae]|uniref:acylphosphatase n=1 Tax=Ancylobacter sp. sgz301288 TaxID=3342077 RepID=UPI00385881C2